MRYCHTHGCWGLLSYQLCNLAAEYAAQRQARLTGLAVAAILPANSYLFNKAMVVHKSVDEPTL